MLVVPFALAGLVLALATLPDNVAYVQARHEELPQRPHLVWGPATQEVLAYLAGLDEPKRVLAVGEALGRNVCAQTHHRSAFGTALTTPFHFERREQMETLRARPREEPPIIAWAEILVLGARDPAGPWLESSGPWDRALLNGEWRVLRRRVAPTPSR
jgi:hypothetical protein